MPVTRFQIGTPLVCDREDRADPCRRVDRIPSVYTPDPYIGISRERDRERESYAGRPSLDLFTAGLRTYPIVSAFISTGRYTPSAVGDS